MAFNAAWEAPSGSLSAVFQAGALIGLFGDVDAAFEIYYDIGVVAVDFPQRYP